MYNTHIRSHFGSRLKILAQEHLDATWLALHELKKNALAVEGGDFT